MIEQRSSQLQCKRTEAESVDITVQPCSVDLTAFGGYPNSENSDDFAVTGDGKDASAFGLDTGLFEGENLLEIMHYYSENTQKDYYYGVGVLGDLAPEETVELRVRYIVNNGEMPTDSSGTYLLPPLDLLAATVVVPEPSTALLLGSGLLGLAVAGKRRS